MPAKDQPDQVGIKYPIASEVRILVSNSPNSSDGMNIGSAKFSVEALDSRSVRREGNMALFWTRLDNTDFFPQ
jgi:hypothetical protein